MRQVHAEIVHPLLLAGDIDIGFAKIGLGMTWSVAEWNEHFLGAQFGPRHILPHDRHPAAKAMLVPQPLKDPLRRVPLLAVHLAVIRQNLVNHPSKRLQLARAHQPFAPMLRRLGEGHHFTDRVAVHAKIRGRFPLAHPAGNRAANLHIKFHWIHPPAPVQKTKGL